MNARQSVYMSTYLMRDTDYYYVKMTENNKAVSLWFDKDINTHLTIVEFKNPKEIELQIIWMPEESKDDEIEKQLITIYNQYNPKEFVNVKYL